MTLYNTTVEVVALIETNSEDKAIEELAHQLRRRGFDVLLDDADAFESEDQPS